MASHHDRRASLIERIEALFMQHGAQVYDGARREPVTALQHALQCALLAEQANADSTLVAAALLHDVGHFLDIRPEAHDADDVHEYRALALLAEGFGPAVIEPIRLHVQAKRYLVATDPGYAATLTPASTHSLALQGGPMSRDEQRYFEVLPFATRAIVLRRWDDLAKQADKTTPPLAYYLRRLADVPRDPAFDSSAPDASLSFH